MTTSSLGIWYQGLMPILRLWVRGGLSRMTITSWAGAGRVFKVKLKPQRVTAHFLADWASANVNAKKS